MFLGGEIHHREVKKLCIHVGFEQRCTARREKHKKPESGQGSYYQT